MCWEELIHQNVLTNFSLSLHLALEPVGVEKKNMPVEIEFFLLCFNSAEISLVQRVSAKKQRDNWWSGESGGTQTSWLEACTFMFHKYTESKFTINITTQFLFSERIKTILSDAPVRASKGSSFSDCKTNQLATSTSSCIKQFQDDQLVGLTYLYVYGPVQYLKPQTITRTMNVSRKM